MGFIEYKTEKIKKREITPEDWILTALLDADPNKGLNLFEWNEEKKS